MSGQRVAYIRVSSIDQNEARQLESIGKVDRTFIEKASAKDTNRPELQRMLGHVRSGDTVICHSMDRLARNLGDLRALVTELTKRGVRVEFKKESLVFTGDDNAMAVLLLSMMGAFAEFERALIKERQKEGIAIARAEGRYKGRSKALNAAQSYRAARTGCCGCSQSQGCTRVRHQQRDSVHIP